MKKILMMLFSVTVIFYFVNCSAEPDAKEQAEKKLDKQTEQTAKVTWLGFNEGLKKAAKEKKNILVDFYTDWCHWCKVLDEKTFKDPQVSKKLADRFITIRINAESTTESVQYKGNTFSNIELTQAFRVTGFPSLGFLNADGDVITLVPGFVPPETFIYILDYIDKECYKKQMSFEEFMKKKGECETQESK
ncbi:thioredoxin fold domain-containing protein [candidate division KSB1 bacterium]|nr:thioredoxin fold domain-containing protein [candidate division KSB1 bacterium]